MQTKKRASERALKFSNFLYSLNKALGVYRSSLSNEKVDHSDMICPIADMLEVDVENLVEALKQHEENAKISINPKFLPDL